MTSGPPAARQLVFVSGAPGAGKTTLAVPLAAELGFALIRKDRIKETLHDAMGAPPPDLAWSRTLGAAAMELLWALAADAPAVVLEANFRPHSDYERGKLAALAPHPVEVYCHCDPQIAARRYDDRARTCHPVHVLASLTAAARAEYDQPVGIGSLITVNTERRVDVPAVAAAVQAHLAALMQAHSDRLSVGSPGQAGRYDNSPATARRGRGHRPGA